MRSITEPLHTKLYENAINHIHIADSSDSRCISETNKMRIFNTLAVGFAGVFCLLIGAFDEKWPKTGAGLFTAYVLCTGLNPGGFYKCATLSTRQYAHFVLATIQFMKCVALFVAPAMVALLVHDETRHDQWRYVYWINGVLLILANAVFLPYATDKPAPFTMITRRSTLEVVFYAYCSSSLSGSAKEVKWVN
ncbi:hypothetical protein COOONC_20948 [Cooperia oncophora]